MAFAKYANAVSDLFGIVRSGKLFKFVLMMRTIEVGRRGLYILVATYLFLFLMLTTP